MRALTYQGPGRKAWEEVRDPEISRDGIDAVVRVDTVTAAVLTVEATREQVNDAFRSAAVSGQLSGLLKYSTDPIVSRDVIGDPSSCIFDSELTQAAGPLVKVFGWYDNEWGYTCRLADLTAFVGGQF
jgi:glyceraldehyde 3-phosphate dehydrogenase